MVSGSILLPDLIITETAIGAAGSIPSHERQSLGRPHPVIHTRDRFTLRRRFTRPASHFLKDTWLSIDGWPASRFTTLMSSSIAGQCTPRPPPMNRQERRSCGVACIRRGYQASGAAMVRPSASSTDNVSSLILTSVARASRVSIVEELIPTLQQLLPVLLDQRSDPADLASAETAATLEAHGVEPEVGLPVITFNVDVWRLSAITRVEKETERPDPKYSRHRPILPRPRA